MMMNAVRQRTVVGDGGKIEIVSPDLQPGDVVDVIVVVEPAEQDTTEYLLSTEANRQHLLKALKDLDDRQRYVYVRPDDL